MMTRFFLQISADGKNSTKAATAQPGPTSSIDAGTFFSHESLMDGSSENFDLIPESAAEFLFQPQYFLGFFTDPERFLIVR